MHNLPLVLREQPQGTFHGGARLRGYTGPKVNSPKVCVCCIPVQQNADIDKNIGALAEKYGLIAYTIELHFSHCAPLIIRDRASTRATIYDIVTDILITLDESQIQMIEEIQIEYLGGNTYELSQTEINEIRLLILELKKGGYVVQKNDYMTIPAMRGGMF